MARRALPPMLFQSTDTPQFRSVVNEINDFNIAFRRESSLRIMEHRQKMLICAKCDNALSRGVTVSESNREISGRIRRQDDYGDGRIYEKPATDFIPVFWELDDLIPGASESEPFGVDDVGPSWRCMRPRRCKRCETILGVDRRHCFNDDYFEAYPEQTMLADERPPVRMAYATSNVFDEAIQQECRTWSQKNECKDILQGLIVKLKDIDIQMIQFWLGEIPNGYLPWERKFYDEAEPVVSLKKRLSTLRTLMRQQVYRCDITPNEKEVLIQECNQRLKMFQGQLIEAEQRGQCARTVKQWQAKVQKALRRRQQLMALTTKVPES